jgi:ribonucleotide monophosphatase NagD (HAD superfamily)
VLFAALSVMYDVDPIVLGKPSRPYADAVADAVGGPSTRIAMIGDSQSADIGIAALLGCDSVFLSRYAIKAIDTTLVAPTYVAASLADEFVPYGERNATAQRPSRRTS